ncbi:50S ribosomal protein L4 [Candidatus Dojkabacteria bacterium]|nr:50S ribosomal protein L4 [Candidatus Dojkabacteria bacterium]
MKIKLFDKKGKALDTSIDLDEAVWAVSMNEGVVSQAVNVYLDNQRKGTAHSKTRGDVQGGGRKPWRQKGTGRARQGSIRSPLWIKGGVTFGPVPYKKMKRIPKKINKLAIKCVLSEMIGSGSVSFIEGFDDSVLSSTKNMDNFIKSFFGKDICSKVLIIVNKKIERKEDLLRSVRNLKKVNLNDSLNFNIFELMNSDKVLVLNDSITEIEGRLK